jgi:predicted  nucleic acid-binding Zn-ribbon protein
MDQSIADHPSFKALISEVERLKKRVDGLEYILREEHEKLEKLEHEQEHDHEVIERLESSGSSSLYPTRKTFAVGL